MEVTTREWISFFQEARIPRTAAAQYAMTFVENRITMDMLLDLNKVSTSTCKIVFEGTFFESNPELTKLRFCLP